jgi:hypothetical protein
MYSVFMSVSPSICLSVNRSRLQGTKGSADNGGCRRGYSPGAALPGGGCGECRSMVSVHVVGAFSHSQRSFSSLVVRPSRYALYNQGPSGEDGPWCRTCGETGIRTQGTHRAQRFSRPPHSTALASLQWEEEAISKDRQVLGEYNGG